MLRLRIPQARPLFRDIFHKNPDITAEDVFGSILMLLSEMAQPFDADQVTQLCEEKLPRAVRFGRIVEDLRRSILPPRSTTSPQFNTVLNREM